MFQKAWGVLEVTDWLATGLGAGREEKTDLRQSSSYTSNGPWCSVLLSARALRSTVLSLLSPTEGGLMLLKNSSILFSHSKENAI